MDSGPLEPPRSVTTTQGLLGGATMVLVAIFSTRENAPGNIADWLLLVGIGGLVVMNVVAGYRSNRQSKKTIATKVAQLRHETTRVEVANKQAELNKSESAELVAKVTIAPGLELGMLQAIKDLLNEALRVASEPSLKIRQELIGGLRASIVHMLSGQGLRVGFVSLNGTARVLVPRGWTEEDLDDIASDPEFLKAARELLRRPHVVWLRVRENDKVTHPLIPRGGSGVFLRVPVCVGSSKYGILYVDGTEPESLEDFHRSLAETLAPILATGLKLAEEHEPSNGSKHHVRAPEE